MAGRKQNLNRCSTSGNFSVQKNIYIQGEIHNDKWFNRFSYSFSNIHTLPYLQYNIYEDFFGIFLTPKL